MLYFTKKTANNNKALLAVCILVSRQRYRADNLHI